jgi:hypothetical protein
MTIEQFRRWARQTARMHYDAGAWSTSNRDWAERIRPYDAELADLYVRLAEAQEAIRVYLMKRVGR